jgi:hypothetical protein
MDGETARGQQPIAGPLGVVATGALLNLVATLRITSFVAHEVTGTIEELRG